MPHFARPGPRLVAPLVLLASACAPAVYAPRPIDEAPLQTYAARAPADSGLAALVAAAGFDGAWPPEQWTLETLTLAALYFNPQIATARAQAELAKAELDSAAQGLPLGLRLAAEHHSRQLEGDSPWSLGLALELPLGGGDRRAARIERASALAQVSEVGVAEAAWPVRALVRDALIELQDSRYAIGIVTQRLEARQAMLALVRARVEAGMLSARELGEERAAIAEQESRLAALGQRAQQAEAALAAALGLPLDTVRTLAIAPDALSAGSARPSAEEARVNALRNRLDLQQRLLAYGAADAEVRLAIAQQNPSLSLSPGFLWDQGDRVWSLATELIVPRTAAGMAAVREAVARRELAAQRFSALQFETLAQAEQAVALLDTVSAQERAAAQQAEQSEAQRARVQRLFDAGASGRLELVATQLSAIAARESAGAAASQRLRATAQLENAMQKPLMGAFTRLPDSARAEQQAGL